MDGSRLRPGLQPGNSRMPHGFPLRTASAGPVARLSGHTRSSAIFHLKVARHSLRNLRFCTEEIICCGSGHKWRLPVVTAKGCLLAAVLAVSVIWLTRNKVSVRTYGMGVAFDGRAPWGDVGAESESDTAPTVLYRTVGKSYCYTAFQAPSLRDRLKHENKSHVTVEYNAFTTFGHVGRYTLRSVDGIPLAAGNRIIRDTGRGDPQSRTTGPGHDLAADTIRQDRG
jgi:hypothetical protein